VPKRPDPDDLPEVFDEHAARRARGQEAARSIKRTVTEAARGAAQGAKRVAAQGARDGFSAALTDFPFPWQQPTRKPVRTSLSRARIVEVATAIIDAEGTEAVTMRRIATELETGAASLYAYVSGKDEVLALVHDEVMTELVVPDLDPLSWQESIRVFARAAYDVYKRHQDLARMSFGTVPAGEHSLDMTERLLAKLTSAGVPVHLAGVLLDRLALYIGADAFEGWILGNRFKPTADDPRPPVERSADWKAQVQAYFDGLPADRYPTLRLQSAEMFGGDEAGLDRFVLGVDLLIAGVERMLEQA
jgi:AcrR family transcriptional regulator